VKRFYNPSVRLGYNDRVGSVRFNGVLFVAYSNDHPPRHVHGFVGETEAIVDLRLEGTVALAERNDAVRPAKRQAVGSEENFEYRGSAL
jgi:hypothetical protein